VRNLNPLARARKHHSVLTDNVTPAHGGKTDGIGWTFTGMALAFIDCDFSEISTKRFCHYLPHPQRSTGRGIYLMTMMGFDDLYIITLTQHPGCHFQEFKGHINSHAHVGSKYDSDIL
jgi:hypothetical protein